MLFQYPHARAVAAATLLTLSSANVLADDNIDELRAELDNLKAEYEARIQSLEQRLQRAEGQLAETTVTPTPQGSPAANYTAGASAYSSASNKYNPAIGVILNGSLNVYDEDPDDNVLPGFPAGGESGLADEGLSIGESEFIFTSNIDDWFYGQVTASVEQEDGSFDIGLEEAFLDTLSLPGNTTLRFGRFYSSAGYLNNKHAHTWAFADQALPYRAFLGNQYGDDGVQLRWLAPTDLYLELGGEVFRGSNYPAEGDADDGLGARSLFVHTGGDVGFSHSWSAGLSWLGTESEQRESGDEDDPLLFDGDTDLYIANLVWKWAPNGNYRQRNFTLQAEYLWRDEDGDYRLPGDDTGHAVDSSATGWYAQAIYQWRPQWRAGIRIDGLDGEDPGGTLAGTPLDPGNDDALRYSFMVDYSRSEFSRIRAQFNRDESGPQDDNQFILQYIMSIGAHGAHEF